MQPFVLSQYNIVTYPLLRHTGQSLNLVTTKFMEQGMHLMENFTWQGNVS